jgi:hypothetical protein
MATTPARSTIDGKDRFVVQYLLTHGLSGLKNIVRYLVAASLYGATCVLSLAWHLACRALSTAAVASVALAGHVYGLAKFVASTVHCSWKFQSAWDSSDTSASLDLQLFGGRLRCAAPGC